MMNLLLLILCIPAIYARYDVKNILMFIVDDLRPELGAYLDTDEAYFPNMQTPIMDTLASESVVFRKAFTQYPMCGPSRASLLTGRRPDTTLVNINALYWRNRGGNFSSMPQYFKENGFQTYGAGKVFHTYDQDDDYSWTEDNYAPTTKDFWHEDGMSWGIAVPDVYETIPLPCMQTRDYTIDKLRNISQDEQPFFMAVGFEKPHLPFLSPRQFYDQYPEGDIYLPNNPYVPENYPEQAWAGWGDLRFYTDISSYNITYNTSVSDELALELRRAYYASVSYTDTLIGEVLQELTNLGLEDNTAILLLSDHGFHLGEHSSWTKCTNLYLDTHIPMMLKIPGVTEGGLISNAMVENIDIFPTLVDIVGLPALELCPEDSSDIKVCTEGVSMTPLIDNPETEQFKSAVFSQFFRAVSVGINNMGYSIATEEYRYIKWVQYFNQTADWDIVRAEELYDQINDPNENINVAGYPEYAQIQMDMEERLMAGWRAAMPQ